MKMKMNGDPLVPICPSTIICELARPSEAPLSTHDSRPAAAPIVFSLDRNKRITQGKNDL